MSWSLSLKVYLAILRNKLEIKQGNVAYVSHRASLILCYSVFPDCIFFILWAKIQSAPFRLRGRLVLYFIFFSPFFFPVSVTSLFYSNSSIFCGFFCLAAFSFLPLTGPLFFIQLEFCFVWGRRCPLLLHEALERFSFNQVYERFREVSKI